MSNENKTQGHTEVLEGRDAKVITIDTNQWITEALSGERNDVINDETKLLTDNLKKYRNVQTPMMEIINHHDKVIAFTTRMQQLNIGLTLSDETKLRKERLPFSRVAETLHTVHATPRFPAALEYSAVRSLKDKDKDGEEWVYSKHGLQVNPIILSEKPWPEINEKINQYLASLYGDIILYWVNAWISLELLKLVLS